MIIKQILKIRRIVVGGINLLLDSENLGASLNTVMKLPVSDNEGAFFIS
jgi:hypothetical protein